MNNNFVSADPTDPSLGTPLGSDLAEVHPRRDAFGYASFARAIAGAVRTTPSPAGLVMAIDGPWGAGKTTLLNFVKHYLVEADAADGTGGQLILIDFNPWWFADGEQLARQFLQQFAAQLPVDKDTRLDAVKSAIAGYADAIGEAASWGIALKTGTKWPIVQKIVGGLLRKLAPREKDVAALKRSIARSLDSAGKRFAVVVDDIDRLRPHEVNEVFRVIKAIADFPNVVYLLAYDGSVVSQSLESSMGIRDGRAYMEKIVQAQFSLPAVSRAKLLRKLSSDLDELLARIGVDEFDNDRWVNAFHDGLDRLVRRPRDIVRIINALSVTVSPLLGEVNVVDFIALEFLRVFVPTVHLVIKENEGMFVGLSGHDARGAEGAFHDGWLNTVSHEQHDAVRNVVQRLFPRLQSLWSNVHFDASEVRRWSADARVAAPDHYPKYFEFNVPDHTLSRAELRAFIALGADVDALEGRWRAAMMERREDETTKAHDLIDALVERDDLDAAFARSCLEAIFRLGDTFLADLANRPQGFFGVPPEVRLYWLANHLVARLPDATREDEFLEVVRGSSSVTWLCHLATSIDAMNRPDADRRESAFQGFSSITVNEIVCLALGRIRDAAYDRSLLTHPDLLFFLHRWSEWGDSEEVRVWVRGITDSDAGLLLLLKGAIRVSTVQQISDAFSRRVESIRPSDLAAFIDVTSPEFMSRIATIRERTDLSGDDRRTIDLFEQGMARRASGSRD
ncbi:P-loop NTPase fold protein [Burkholderia thailandensis]|uniref:KAP family P-loop NTPase fold protein n=1 Tax=Burkholderia thailandensis TaxID=57975 RepID=UPI003B50BE20